jgi:DNA-binding NtrC family response regulator
MHEVPSIEKGDNDALMENDWRGSIRERENVMKKQKRTLFASAGYASVSIRFILYK